MKFVENLNQSIGINNSNDHMIHTQNGAVARDTTYSKLYDFFAFGGAMRSNDEHEIIDLFEKAREESINYAYKCLFYLRDVRGGQGERRLFRIILKHCAFNHTNEILPLISYIPEYGRWDDVLELMYTPVQDKALLLIKSQWQEDVRHLAKGENVSLLGKWLYSENSKGNHDKMLMAKIIRQYLGFNAREYRQTLSRLREKIRVTERFMSQNRWNEIDYSAVPSKAGLNYIHAFYTHDPERYVDFVNDKKTKPHTGTLYPYDIMHVAAMNIEPDIVLNKYWDNLTDYFKERPLNALVMADTSGSMNGTPKEVAGALALYCAEHAQGPFKDTFMTFSSKPQLFRFKYGTSFAERAHEFFDHCINDNTNIEAAFDVMLKTAVDNHIPQSELPDQLIIISDMEFDAARQSYSTWYHDEPLAPTTTLIESISHKWNAKGYTMPHIVFWNVNAMQKNAPMLADDGVTYVSGFSPIIFESLVSGKTGMDVMFSFLDSERYANIVAG